VRKREGDGRTVPGIDSARYTDDRSAGEELELSVS
jgi:hypothetical protein